MITQERLKELLNYNPATGIFVWNCSSGSATRGSIAGCVNRRGYTQIRIAEKTYFSHRLVFLYMTGYLPKKDVDHINQKKSDNSWINLREVSSQENQRNRKRSANNASGITGVHWTKRARKWRAQIKISRNQVHLGVFDNIFDAACARRSAEIKHQFHKNHGQGIK